MSTLSVLLPAAISAIVGFGFAHYISRKINSNMKSGKILNFLIFVSLGVGITGVLNEFLIATILGTGVRMEKIMIFLFSNIIILPIIFLLIGYVLGKMKSSYAKISDSEEAPKEFNSIVNELSQKKAILIFFGILLIGLLISFFGKTLVARDEFRLSECKNCEVATGCKDYDKFKGFKVLENSVQIFLLDSNNIERIFSLTDDGKMNCKIVKGRNNAFDCSHFEAGEYITSRNDAVFDGKNKFIYNSFMSGSGGGILNDSKMTCKVD